MSGLQIGEASSTDGQIRLLVEYLTGEGGGLDDQLSAARISRLIIVGDSLAPMVITGKGDADAEGDSKKSVRSLCYKNKPF